jgi:hypothetical protein
MIILCLALITAPEIVLIPQVQICGDPESVLFLIDKKSPEWYFDLAESVVADYNSLLGYRFFRLEVADLKNRKSAEAVILLDTLPYALEREQPDPQGIVTNQLFAASGCSLGAHIRLSNRYRWRHQGSLEIVLKSILAQISGLTLRF